MRFAIRLAVSIVALAAFASPSFASNSLAKILIHLAPPTAKNPCGTLPPCSSVVTAGDLSPAGYFAYVLIADGDRVEGLAGLQFGIEYDGATSSGVDILGWTVCASLDFPFPGWPGDGTGNIITWDSVNRCQRTEPAGFGTGVVANAGYFYLTAYSPDNLTLVPRQVDGKAKVADCAAVEYIIPATALGSARFSAGGAESGTSPCDADDLPLACAISGPGSLPRQATAQYSAATNQPGSTFAWSVDGGTAAIVGSTSGSTVIVNSGATGTFQLTATVSNGAAMSQCEIDVTVTGIDVCTITGPDLVLAGTTDHAYSVASGGPGASFNWSITGNGSLTSPATGSAVTVNAGPAGSYTLTVAVTADGFTGTCQKFVEVANEADCVISGPGSVAEGSGGNLYQSSVVPAADSYAWSIVGDGIISGSSTGSSVSVVAGSTGSFTLSLATLSGSIASNCEKIVTVTGNTSSTCGITGPDPVVEGKSVQYQGSSSYSSVSYLWSISGSGSIVGSTTTSVVHVTAGPTGSFLLRLVASGPAVADTCVKLVTVSPSPPSQPGLNNNAKILVHLTSITNKNACTRAAAHPACGQIVNEGNIGTYYYAHVLVADGYTNGALLSGVGGVDFGITYNNTLLTGVDIYSWHLCADNEIPTSNWPESGGSNRVTWNASTRCQRLEPGGTGTGVVATPGYFYMGAYSPDVLAIVKPADAEAKVHDCQGYPSTISLQNLGSAAFGGTPGYNPCGDVVNLQTTTWSRIKALFRPEE